MTTSPSTQPGRSREAGEHPLQVAIDDGPMSRAQWRVVALCVLLNVFDGFDVLVMAFTGRSVSEEWGLNGAQLGLLLSAGLVGMAAGSLLIAPWADRIGRKPVILVCLGLAGVGMLASSVSQSALQLGLLRVLTGLGIGGILASSNVLVAEYASRRWRGLAVSLNSTGYAIGATLGGLMAVLLIGQFGWRSVFLCGGLVTLLAVPLVARQLPESLAFLLTRRPDGALARVNSIARRLGHQPLDRLDGDPLAPQGVHVGFGALLSARLRRPTLTLWAGFFLVMAGFYFVTSWTPTLLVAAGLSTTQSLTGGTLLNLGGIFGITAFGGLTTRFRLRSVLIGYLLATAVLLAVFGAVTSTFAAAVTVAILIGIFVNGCVGGLYALMPMVYDAGVRTTGVGTAIGVGRIGAILSPFVAGALIDSGWQPEQLFVAVAALFLAAAVLLLAALRSQATDSAPVGEELPADRLS